MRRWTRLTMISALFIFGVSTESLTAAERGEHPEVKLSEFAESVIPEDAATIPWHVQTFGRTVLFLSVNFSEFVWSGDWDRLWGVNEPDVATPYRVHGGVI